MKKFLLYAIVISSVFSCQQEDFVGSDTETGDPKINRIYAVVSESSKDFAGLQLNVELGNKSFRPSFVYLNGTMLFDNGSGLDKIANDGIYSVMELYRSQAKGLEKGTLFEFDPETAVVKTTSAKTQACTIGLYGDGEMTPCGRCPAESITGGDTWFCICIQDCWSF